jgi:hypothetical protein
VWAAERSGDPADAAPREGAGESRSAIPQPDRVVAGQRVGTDIACHVGGSSLIERLLTLDTAECFTGGAHHRGGRGHGHTASPDSAWAAVLGSNVGSGIRSEPVHEEDRHPDATRPSTSSERTATRDAQALADTGASGGCPGRARFRRTAQATFALVRHAGITGPRPNRAPHGFATGAQPRGG